MPDPLDYAALAQQIRAWGSELGFQAVGFADIDLQTAEQRLLDWLAAGFHGEMEWMERHGLKRSRPSDLVPGTLSVVCVRMDYLPGGAAPEAVLRRPELGYVARYALGRDYHKLIRARLQRLAALIQGAVGPFGHRVFTDSAPVLEKPLAAKAGLGWVGRHSNLLCEDSGNWFFLGEVYTDLPLPPDRPQEDHCGTCRACMQLCPTGAIVAPYVVDARRCISYLTIELRGSIPVDLRPLMGNRIYGCDDCLLACPWNRFAPITGEPDFQPRHGLDAPELAGLFAWTEAEFLQRMEGSAIRRIGYECWLRNIAVALGNGPTSPVAQAALAARIEDPSALVREHVRWALGRMGPDSRG